MGDERRSHVKRPAENLVKMSEILVADAGYVSEENFEFLERNNIEAFVKYQYFHKEQSKKWRTDPYRAENLPYDEKDDSFSARQVRK